MSLLEKTLTGKQIEAVLSDSEVTYLMLADGTQVTIRGLIVIQPAWQRLKSGEQAMLASE